MFFFGVLEYLQITPLFQGGVKGSGRLLLTKIPPDPSVDEVSCLNGSRDSSRSIHHLLLLLYS